MAELMNRKSLNRAFAAALSGLLAVSTLVLGAQPASAASEVHVSVASHFSVNSLVVDTAETSVAFDFNFCLDAFPAPGTGTITVAVSSHSYYKVVAMTPGSCHNFAGTKWTGLYPETGTDFSATVLRSFGGYVYADRGIRLETGWTSP
jgi:hypothetical protein